MIEKSDVVKLISFLNDCKDNNYFSQVNIYPQEGRITVWIDDNSYFDFKEGYKECANCYFDDGGVDVNLQSDCIYIDNFQEWLDYFCSDSFDIFYVFFKDEANIEGDVL